MWELRREMHHRSLGREELRRGREKHYSGREGENNGTNTGTGEGKNQIPSKCARNLTSLLVRSGAKVTTEFSLIERKQVATITYNLIQKMERFPAFPLLDQGEDLLSEVRGKDGPEADTRLFVVGRQGLAELPQ